MDRSEGCRSDAGGRLFVFFYSSPAVRLYVDIDLMVSNKLARCCFDIIQGVQESMGIYYHSTDQNLIFILFILTLIKTRFVILSVFLFVDGFTLL